MKSIYWGLVCLVAIACAACGGTESGGVKGVTGGLTSSTGYVLTVTLNPKCVQGKGPNGYGSVAFNTRPLEGPAVCHLAGDNAVICQAAFAKGSMVAMTATPTGPMSAFERYSGAKECSADPGCRFKIEADKQMTANFCTKAN